MTTGGFANPIFVALDTPYLEKAIALAESVHAHVGGLKIGLEFISANGPEGVNRIAALGLPVFADVKFHDIPNTVAGAVSALSGLGIAMLNVHASGGEAMMRAAADAAAAFTPRPKVIGVTVLTSLDGCDLGAIGVSGGPMDQVVRLAKLAQASGLAGVVCSPQEIVAVRAACGHGFLIVTPGVRHAGADMADQKRTMTPGQAARAGADVLVIGRPITGAADPGVAARAIAEELRLASA